MSLTFSRPYKIIIFLIFTLQFLHVKVNTEYQQKVRYLSPSPDTSIPPARTTATPSVSTRRSRNHSLGSSWRPPLANSPELTTCLPGSPFPVLMKYSTLCPVLWMKKLLTNRTPNCIWFGNTVLYSETSGDYVTPSSSHWQSLWRIRTDCFHFKHIFARLNPASTHEIQANLYLHKHSYLKSICSLKHWKLFQLTSTDISCWRKPHKTVLL